MGRWAGPAALGIVVSGCSLFGGIVQAPQAVSIDCATAAVIGLNWSGVSANVTGYRILRNGLAVGIVSGSSFADTSVEASTTYEYVIAARDASGNTAASDPLKVTTAPASRLGDAPYCPSALISALAWDWPHAYRAAEGSDLWPVTWGQDGNVYAFFGDGGGFGGDDRRGRTSFGIARIKGPPPPAFAAENVYGGYQAGHPALLSGKARSLIAIGSDFYAIAGIYRRADPKGGDPQPIAGSPGHVEIVYSRHNAHSWQDSDWTFCNFDSPPQQLAAAFCPAGFVNFGRGNAGALGPYVYMYGNSPAADRRAVQDAPGARTYLARVERSALLVQAAYQYFAGLDSRSRPVWSTDVNRVQPVFTDRNPAQPGCGGQCAMSSTLEEAVYDPALKRYIGVAQGDYLAQTSFYEATNPWGPWAVVSYHNIDASNGSGGWGNLGTSAGESLGVHIVNAWTSMDGRTLWMAYSSDGEAPSGALFPPSGSKLDALHLVRADLTVAAFR